MGGCALTNPKYQMTSNNDSIKLVNKYGITGNKTNGWMLFNNPTIYLQMDYHDIKVDCC